VEKRIHIIQLLCFCICIPFPRSSCSFNADTSLMKAFIHSSMLLQTFVGPCPLLQFHNLFYTDGRTSWTRDQPVARPLPTQRATQTQNKRNTDIHEFEWDSNPRSQRSSERITFHSLDQTATVIGLVQIYAQKFHNRSSIFTSLIENIAYIMFLAFKRDHM
jgi:hypothetical protein